MPRCASPRTRPIPPAVRYCSACRSGERRSRRSSFFLIWSGPRCRMPLHSGSCRGRSLDFARHHLENVRRYREHLLSEPEEKVLAEKSVTGSNAWARLFEELTSAIEVEALTDERGCPRRRPEPPGAARSRAAAHDRRGRHRGARARIADACATCSTHSSPTRPPTTACAAIRSWLAARNLANEASDESVRALIEAVRGRYELPRRWYRLKAKLLGVPAARRLRPHGRRDAG